MKEIVLNKLCTNSKNPTKKFRIKSANVIKYYYYIISTNSILGILMGKVVSVYCWD